MLRANPEPASSSVGWRTRSAGSRSVRDHSLKHIKTDASGRFRVEGLAPGLKYELQVLGNGGFFGAVFKGLTIKAGESRDLGDVKNMDDVIGGRADV